MTSLTNQAVDLLLQVMETRAAKVQAATLRHVAPRATDQLLGAKLLVASGHIPVVTAMDAFEDEPIPAEWCAEREAGSSSNRTNSIPVAPVSQRGRPQMHASDRNRPLRLEAANVPENADRVMQEHLLPPIQLDRWFDSNTGILLIQLQVD